MAERLIVHIGAMKSGTSFLQNVLMENSEVLGEHSMKLAGRQWTQQVHAVHELITYGGPRQKPMPPDGEFASLVEEVNAYPGTSVISMEFLGPREKNKIRLLLDSFPDTDLEVVLTARDLTRSLPAMWQESVQNGGVQTWESYLSAVRAEPKLRDGPGRKFWQHQGLASIASRWSTAVGKERFTLITVPPPGSPSSLLWDRFAQVLGIEPSAVTLGVRANPSIGPASAMVLRAMNERMEQDPLSRKAYNRFVKHLLAKEILAQRGVSEPTLGLDDAWVIERGEREVAALRALDLRVIGDLEELRPAPLKGIAPQEITVEQQLDAAVDGLVEVIRRWSDARARAARSR
jgi:hypothetical protein